MEGNPSPGGGAPGNHEAGLRGSAATMVISGRLEDGAPVRFSVGNKLPSLETQGAIAFHKKASESIRDLRMVFLVPVAA